MEARCQCAAVSFTTPLPEPLALYICHCNDCKRQTGSAFGASAIFPRFKLPEAELLSCYARKTPSGHTLYCYFCRNCGTRLLHATDTKKIISVKAGCLDGLDWSKAIHLWTNNAMVPIPEGSETHSEEPDTIKFNGGDADLLKLAGPLTGSGSCHMSPGDQKDSASKAELAGPMVGACELSG